ncbi:MAG: hypothetical protein IAF58_02535 [Leptolyngbya sp.]|nr:hypothetical protein [Candidatus Melainabacteria bacterium]
MPVLVIDQLEVCEDAEPSVLKRFIFLMIEKLVAQGMEKDIRNCINRLNASKHLMLAAVLS